MEPPSVPAHRGWLPWQGLLLTASLLPFWSLPATAITIELMPPNAVEGGDVFLLAHEMPENTLRIDWYKDTVEPNNTIMALKLKTQEIIQGPLYSNREDLFFNGSLHIRMLTQADTGTYLIYVVTENVDILHKERELRVYTRLPKPNISVSNHTGNPVENVNSVVLTCEPDTPDTTYRWFLDTRPVQNGAGQRNLSLSPVKRNDTGSYQCETRNSVSVNRSDQFNLTVDYGPDPPVISPSKTYYRRGANLSLSCHTASHPDAQFSWFIGDRFLASTQTFSIPVLSLNHSGSYACLVNNSATGLSETEKINITVLDAVSQPSIHSTNTTVTEGHSSLVMVCLTNDTGIFTQWFFNNEILLPSETRLMSTDNRTLTLQPVSSADAGDYQCEVTNPISTQRSPILKLEVTSTSSALSAGAIAGIVIGVLAGVAMIGGLAYFLYSRKTGGANDQRHHTENKLPSSNNSQDHSDNPPNKVDEVAYSCLDFNAQKHNKEISATPHPTASETIYAQVKKK